MWLNFGEIALPQRCSCQATRSSASCIPRVTLHARAGVDDFAMVVQPGASPELHNWMVENYALVKEAYRLRRLKALKAQLPPREVNGAAIIPVLSQCDHAPYGWWPMDVPRLPNWSMQSSQTLRIAADNSCIFFIAGSAMIDPPAACSSDEAMVSLRR